MESLNIQEQQQGQELGQKHREGSYPLLSSDAVDFEEENGSAVEDCKGKGKAVEGWTYQGKGPSSTTPAEGAGAFLLPVQLYCCEL
ncbi:hypothetical protein PISMIDRAFT_10355 [Pisolithus microcarpus 441]|uniref:Unplaced genomic scaffold scaffold_34, whole genome shotgun sequence n=1 Tax=Pisolithus microcarpus 441 TaxID=765257 RepID=A0A0C9ZE55_9AGAM|nr:hypothetical protein BKA83DRAFT_10355 [Pisolithus microcarpus]KIK24209.1 hypothetical protein PISMIDRAFT_10355 [Pisolithus microcarpus 441]